LSTNGLFTVTQQKLSEQANKALFSFYKYIGKFVNLKPLLQMELFDKLITPILCYACQVWGFHPAPAVENTHLKFCKKLLSVKRSTSNCMVYGELGILPLYIVRYFHIIKYWLQIVTGSKSYLVNVIYESSISDIERQNTPCWTRSVRDLLLNSGLGEAWYNQGVGDIHAFLLVFKERIKDMYVQNWHQNLVNSSKCRFYVAIKDILGLWQHEPIFVRCNCNYFRPFNALHMTASFCSLVCALSNHATGTRLGGLIGRYTPNS
jgi:hypothetical protein